MLSFRYHMPTEVHFGPGCIEMLRDTVARFGRRPLIVTGRNAVRAMGLRDRIARDLPSAVFFEAVTPEPGTAVCDAGARVCRENRCDCVVAVGGGSPMDAAKAIAWLAWARGAGQEPGAHWLRDKPDAAEALPLIAVPTTAGTGSEVTPYSVLVEPDEGIKRTLRGRGLFPAVALLDPELTTPLPRVMTISSGLDALSQAMEGYVSTKSTPPGDALALEAARLAAAALPRVAETPEDIDARGRMLHAAMLTGMVIAQSGTTLVHGMGYYYTCHFGVPHGLANGLLLTPVFQYNARHVPGKVARLAQAIGADIAPDSATREQAAAAVGAALHRLFGRIGLSPAARDHGVDGSRLAWCASDIHRDASRFKNQHGKLSEVEVYSLFQQSYDGAGAG